MPAHAGFGYEWVGVDVRPFGRRANGIARAGRGGREGGRSVARPGGHPAALPRWSTPRAVRPYSHQLGGLGGGSAGGLARSARA